MGILHAVYGKHDKRYSSTRFNGLSVGFGALCAPLSATRFAQMKYWSFHYLISLALSLFNLIVLVATFRFKSQDGVFLRSILSMKMFLRYPQECLNESGEVVPPHVQVSSSEEQSKFRQMLQFKVVHLLALFLILYVGVEVTIGGRSHLFCFPS